MIDVGAPAFDTDQITTPTPRPFFSRMLEDGGRSLHVLPTVYEEMLRTVPASERRNWIRAIDAERKRRTPISEATEARTLQAAWNAALEWLQEERDREESGIQVATPSEAELNEATGIAERMPDSCFPARQYSQTFNDRRIISEGIVLGFESVITDTILSVDHLRLNRWRADSGLMPRGAISF